MADNIRKISYTLTDSTNEQAKLYAKSSWNGEPTLFTAEEQTNGRGRYGRKFHSENASGAYLSLLFKPNSSITDTTVITALAANSMIKAIESLAEVHIGIKWVNDLMLEGRKLGGILIEGSIDPETKKFDYLIAGIGVNLYIAERDEEIRGIAISLEEATGKRIDKALLIDSFVSIFLKELGEEKLRAESPDAESEKSVYAFYRSRLLTLGREVTVKTLTDEYPAEAIDLLPDFSLLVKTGSGEERRIFTGEVSVRTRAGMQ